MKMQRNKKVFMMLLALLIVVVAAGCSGTDEAKTETPEVLEVNGNDENTDSVDAIEDSAIEPTVDVDEIEFSLGGEDYGKDGMVYTSTGSMKMEIPEDWEVQIALHETSLGVRSSSENGDTISASIEEYSSMIKEQADRTPENQAKQNNESAIITKDKWGNTDVFYRITEWTDYVAIAGYAAYDDDEYVNFDIRSKKINGTLEEFMKSKAWDTLKTTFELKTP